MFKPTLRQLEYFYSLSRTSSFSQSAKDCCVGQSTLSSAIKDLETGIGFQLFERTSRRVFLTAQGELFLKSTKIILSKQDDLLKDIQKLNDPDKEIIRLGIIPTIAPFLLTKIISDKISFTFREGLSPQLIEDLEENRIDIALLALPYPLKPHFKTLSLFDDPLYTAFVPGKDNLPYIFLEDGHCLRDQAISSCHIKPNMISSQFRGSSLNSVLSLVENGIGQAIIPEMGVEFFSFYKNIEYKRTEPESSRKICLTWINSKHESNVLKVANIIKGTSA